MYWEGQKYIEMDDKDDNQQDESMFMVQMILIDGNSMQQMTKKNVKVDLDEHCLDSMTSGNTRRTISNLETLIGIMTSQGAWRQWH